jgi:hypothetical protein
VVELTPFVLHGPFFFSEVSSSTAEKSGKFEKVLLPLARSLAAGMMIRELVIRHAGR